jgi:RimJ/RimL family protein N-acetyltransferase
MSAGIELHTERLLLRQFKMDDVSDAMMYRNDEEFARFLSHIPLPFTRQDSEAFVKRNMSEPWDKSPIFAVVLDGKLIGTVNLEVISEARTAMLGYAIGRQWWGRGIATEAARAAMGWGIQAFGLTRIWASTDIRHVKSHRVLEKLGLKRELFHTGHHRGRNRELIDEIVYGLDLTHSSSDPNGSRS